MNANRRLGVAIVFSFLVVPAPYKEECCNNYFEKILCHAPMIFTFLKEVSNRVAANEQGFMQVGN